VRVAAVAKFEEQLAVNGVRFDQVESGERHGFRRHEHRDADLQAHGDA
jgi:hypothetical protein